MDTAEFNAAHDRNLEKGQQKDIQPELDELKELNRNDIDTVREAFIEVIQFKENDALFWSMMMYVNKGNKAGLGLSTHEMFERALTWIAESLHAKKEAPRL